MSVPVLGVPPPAFDLIQWIREKVSGLIGLGTLHRPPRPLWGLLTALVCYGTGFLPLLAKRPETRLFWQMLHLALAGCLLPGAAAGMTQRHGHIARVFAESVLLLMLLVEFTMLGFGWARSSWEWIIEAAGIVVLIEAGSHGVVGYKDAVLRRLSNRVNPADRVILDKIFRRELALYLPFPVALIASAVTGVITGAPPTWTLALCARIVLVLASLTLIGLLALSARRMAASLYHPPSRRTTTERDVAYDVTAQRKIYLYNSLHNVTLAISFIVVLGRTWGVMPHRYWLILLFAVSAAVFVQLPYGIGQWRMHQEVLGPVPAGEARGELEKKLKELAPYFPKYDFLTSLVASPVLGWLLVTIADPFVKEFFKRPSP